MESSRPITLSRIGMILFLLAILLLLVNAQRDLQRRLAPADSGLLVLSQIGPTPYPQSITMLPTSTPTSAPVQPPRPTQAVATTEPGFVINQANVVTLATALPYPGWEPLPAEVNGVALDTIIVMPREVRANIERIYLQGQEAGRNSRSFSRIGDSSVADGYFLTRFDGGDYNLGPFAFLQATLDFFAGSFGHDAVTVREGMHSWSVLDPFWSDKSRCEVDETPLACEVRLMNPAFVIIRLGTNDVDTPAYFEKNMREILDSLLGLDIVPILGTKADRIDGANSPNNALVRQMALEYQIPLWDFDLVADSLPGRGLAPDGIHLTTFYAHDYEQAVAYERGHAMQNLTALLMLEQLHRLAIEMELTAAVVED